VNAAEKKCPSELRYLTHTEDQTEPGSRTSRRLKQLLTAHLKESMFAQDAFVQVRLKEHNNDKKQNRQL